MGMQPIRSGCGQDVHDERVRFVSDVLSRYGGYKRQCPQGPVLPIPRISAILASVCSPSKFETGPSPV